LVDRLTEIEKRSSRFSSAETNDYSSTDGDDSYHQSQYFNDSDFDSSSFIDSSQD